MKRAGCEIGDLFGLASRLMVCGLPMLFVWAGNWKVEISKDPDKLLFSSHDLCCFPKDLSYASGCEHFAKLQLISPGAWAGWQ